MPALPDKCSSILDVGSGLGGINILLNRHYGGEREVCLLDGVDDAPEVHLHRQTFNNMAVAQDFLLENDVTRFSYYDAAELGEPRPFDLIVSFASWCFHYPPQVYLDFVRACCHERTVVILDMRSGKPDWHEAMLEHFVHPRSVLHIAEKFKRMTFKIIGDD